jgi:lysophospholipase L1-like esterase
VNKQHIDEVNYNIRWACETLGALFCEVNKYVKYDCLGKDGVHLNRKGSFLLGRYIENAIALCQKEGN